MSELQQGFADMGPTDQGQAVRVSVLRLLEDDEIIDKIADILAPVLAEMNERIDGIKARVELLERTGVRSSAPEQGPEKKDPSYGLFEFRRGNMETLEAKGDERRRERDERDPKDDEEI